MNATKLMSPPLAASDERPTSTPMRAKDFLNALGLYLTEPVGSFLLASMAVGLKPLLIGLPGMAKTMLAQRLGEVLAPGATKTLDASTSSFDEIRGYIQPDSLREGRVQIVPGPWSVYEDRLLFVDELSRAPVYAQSRWLQLIHEHRVDGKETALEWVIAAMNPPNTEGCFGLGTATADRFHLAVQLDTVQGLGYDTLLAIANSAAFQVTDVLVDSLRPAMLTWMRDVRTCYDDLLADDISRQALNMLAVEAVLAWSKAHPWQPQGRRIVSLVKLFALTRAMLSVEHGPDNAGRLYGSQIRNVVTLGLGNIARATDAPEADTRAAIRATQTAVLPFSAHLS